MPSIETLQRVAENLERLSAGGKPGARTLADAGDDDRRGPVADRGEVAPPPEAHARLHLLLLLAIDRDKNWTLVRDDHDGGGCWGIRCRAHRCRRTAPGCFGSRPYGYGADCNEEE